MTDSEKEFLVFLRLIIGIGPGEELKGIVSEMHRHFPEDPPAEVNSMVEVLCGGENHLGMLEVTGIQIDRTDHLQSGVQTKRKFGR